MPNTIEQVSTLWRSLIDEYLAEGPHAMHWDSLRTYKVLEGHTGTVNTCAISPDNTLVASTALDGTLRLWSATNGNQLRILMEPGRLKERSLYNSGDYCVFSPDGKLLAVSMNTDVFLAVWRTTDWSRVPVAGGVHRHRIRCIAFAPDGATLATTSIDKTVKIYSVMVCERGELYKVTEVRQLAGHGTLKAAAFSPCGRHLVTTDSNRGTANVWCTADYSLLHTIEQEEGTRAWRYWLVRMYVLAWRFDKLAIALPSTG